ncbi:MAG: amidase [Nevskiaceae bacterium]|jgi:aspartyl-tRNA(Asn)/glutamyl-tRNA(Gln) amidotransferase subunit A|nr:amidase [Nevskiaceae bacterium]
MTTDHSFTRRGLMAGAAAAAMLGASRSPAAQGNAEDSTRLSVAEASRRIAARELSPVALTQAYLDRIARVGSRINAYVTVTAEQALAQARELEAESARGVLRSPLHGIPIGLKDNIDTAGTLTTAGSAVYADRIPAQDADVVRRLREAGAVFLGKLNMHEFAYGGTSAVTHYGPVHNPWNLAHNPGGSSGGSAAAVAARLCAAALGTDTAASVRFPASCCGVAGLKATHGLASIRGIVPLSEMHDHVGPLARSVEDCALVMTALAGFDPLDPVSIRTPRVDFHRHIGTAVRGLRIGIPRSPFFEDLDPQIDAAVRAALEVLVSLTGVPTRDVSLSVPDTYALLDAETYTYHAPLLADPAKRALYQPLTLQRVMGGASVPATVYIEQRRQMQIARNTVDRVFADVDVLIAPTNMVLPATIEAVLADPANEGSLIRNTLPFNVLGIPSISVPCGFGGAGLPIGMQIIGPWLGEAPVLALAHAYEQVTPWHEREPPIA